MTRRKPRAIGGCRKSLDGLYLRSRMEANYCHYLNWLKSKGIIRGWEYEPSTFEFFRIKKGCRFYTPDFRVIWKDGRIEFHEVKGYMDAKSKTKLKRMAKYYPDAKIIIIDKSVMADIKKKLSAAIPGWESDG